MTEEVGQYVMGQDGVLMAARAGQVFSVCGGKKKEKQNA